MATPRDLATVDTPSRSIPDPTFRRETTLPRATTDLPDPISAAEIIRPRGGKADELARVLGLVNDLGQAALSDVQKRKDAADAGNAALDFASGSKNEQRFAKSRAYRDAWQREGAKKLSIDISNEVTQVVSDRLNDSENPATPEEIDHLIETTFRKHTTDPNGKLLDFGTPEAKTILGHALNEVRANLIPQALKAIKDQTDGKWLTTWADNNLHEYRRGAPIGIPARDPLAPLPQAGEPQPTPKAPVSVSFGNPTGRPPVPGPVTSSFVAHEARGSRGVDLDGKLGDPIEVPAGGKVVAVSSDPKSGLFVKVDHGGGVVSSYAHLQLAKVKVGDVVRPGDTIALMGNSGHTDKSHGDGSHLHWRVKVSGKDVDPMSFAFPGGQSAVMASTGAEPSLVAPASDKVAVQLPPFDFERAMKSVPPSIDKGDAKAFLLQTIFNEARTTGDVGIMAGLEDSHRADGTPSFNPKEIATIIATREAISDHARIVADRAREERYKQNEGMILDALLSPNPPTEAFIIDAAHKDLIPETSAYTLVHQLQSERRQDERELKADLREANAEAEANFDEFVNGEVAIRSTGHSDGPTPTELLQSGKLGTGTRALRRYKQLRAADSEGAAELARDPSYASYGALIKKFYAPQRTASGGYVQAALGGGGGSSRDPVAYAAMLQAYRNKVRSGEDPANAYLYAVSTYGPKGGADTAIARKARIRYLQSKRLSEGR